MKGWMRAGNTSKRIPDEVYSTNIENNAGILAAF